MRGPEEIRPEDPDEKLSVRQAIVVWLAAAVTGWLFTVGVVYLASHVF